MAEANKEVKLSLGQVFNLYQTQKGQLENIAQQRNMISNYLLDVNNAEQSIKELEENTTNEVLFSIGSGIYINAELKEIKKLRVNLGIDIFEDMSFEKAKDFLEKKKAELTKVMERVRQQEQELLKSVSGLEQVLNAAQHKIAEAQKARAQPGKNTGFQQGKGNTKKALPVIS
ncbi:MAG: prefoldin subunit alpha [Candidatus Diapherotrites archaeon CG08_land_8_20_14_0_20_34_12]|nr:MAG: prefoldin subunit alpha [Candidatus Diapherotrites archaeon CG08_land_8_20_14_0_20_34_12]